LKCTIYNYLKNHQKKKKEKRKGKDFIFGFSSLDHFISYNFTMVDTSKEGLAAQQRGLLVDPGSGCTTPVVEATPLFLLRKKQHSMFSILSCYFIFWWLISRSQ
jgi:hypothetical protein